MRPRGYLGNDSDGDRDGLSALLTAGPRHGVLTLNADGSFTYTPDADFYGADGFTYAASDGYGGTATAVVTIDVTPLNDPPTIGTIAGQTIAEDGSTGALPFTVGDVETAPGTLAVTGVSSNPALVPNANIVFGGSGANRTVTVTPAANQFGTATITVTVSDGTTTVSDSFALTVTSVDEEYSTSPCRTATSMAR